MQLNLDFKGYLAKGNTVKRIFPTLEFLATESFAKHSCKLNLCKIKFVRLKIRVACKWFACKFIEDNKFQSTVKLQPHIHYFQIIIFYKIIIVWCCFRWPGKPDSISTVDFEQFTTKIEIQLTKQYYVRYFARFELCREKCKGSVRLSCYKRKIRIL